MLFGSIWLGYDGAKELGYVDKSTTNPFLFIVGGFFCFNSKYDFFFSFLIQRKEGNKENKSLSD